MLIIAGLGRQIPVKRLFVAATLRANKPIFHRFIHQTWRRNDNLKNDGLDSSKTVTHSGDAFRANFEGDAKADQTNVKADQADQANAEFSSSPEKSTIFVPNKFSDFRKKGLIDDILLDAIEKAGFKDLTPIQQKAIIPLLNTKDGIVCRAKTGTGKTLAFLIPTVQSAIEKMKNRKKSKKREKVDTIIIAPTRDLALQIRDEYIKVCENVIRPLRPTISLVIGGQRNTFVPSNPSEIVIATPGRLEADLKHHSFKYAFSNVSYRIYDEADRLLDIGFEPQLHSIDSTLKRLRDKNEPPIKSLLFSATIDKGVKKFAEKHINPNYEFVNTVPKDDPEVHENVHQVLVKCTGAVDKFKTQFNYIADLIKSKENAKIILFLPTQTSVEFFYDYMRRALHSSSVFKDYSSEFRIFHLHGKRSVAQRSAALRGFKAVKNCMLITTDVAARGIDVKGVTHVVQLYPSSDVADYVHKVGRTGRAGAKGKAVLFLTKFESAYVRILEKQRGVRFDETFDSSEIEGTDEFFKEITVDEKVTNDFFFTFMTFLKQMDSVYGLNINGLVAENGILYRTLVHDETAKLESGSLVMLRKRLRRGIIDEYFERDYSNRRYSRDQYNRYEEGEDSTSPFRGRSGFGNRGRDDSYRRHDSYRHHDSYSQHGRGNREQKRNSFSGHRGSSKRDNDHYKGRRSDSFNDNWD
ncbi:MSS116 [Candida oxycetoniae]|uniref:ATP-dependent RNA helicase n=1 Tax=Candida oxycetoniae TaxID=497107 RepID=A0AAI9WZW5_9ASCO|nr:MSS116 [Candida oxycetoniae]KAI3406802.2 MSS116 [Candida oxycetoniae]